MIAELKIAGGKLFLAIISVIFPKKSIQTILKQHLKQILSVDLKFFVFFMSFLCGF